MPTLLSLFDYSGEWSRPYYDHGWTVHQWDIKLDEFMDVNRIETAEIALDLFEDVDGILAAPPCTEFTVSCAQYWNMKDQDGRTAAAVQLVSQVQKLADLFTPTDPDYDLPFFWVAENPVGRLPKLIPSLGRPWYFHPSDFAGWLNPSRAHLARLDKIRLKKGDGVTKEEAQFVVDMNAYTKKTGLWGEFKRPVKKPIEPVRCSLQGSFTQRLGGKSEKTKEERSVTPGGFALAFFDANNGTADPDGEA